MQQVLSKKNNDKRSKGGETQARIFALLDNKQKEIIEFVLSKYNETGVEELIYKGIIPKKQASPQSLMEIIGTAAIGLNHGFKRFKDFTV